MPDGETGERSRWVYFQRQMLLAHPAHGDRPHGAALQVRPMGRQGRARDRAGALQARRRSGQGRVRDRLRQGGRSPPRRSSSACATPAAIARALASRSRLPTPHASGYLYVSGPARQTYFDVYERALKAALANIVKAIPAADLSIQWDVCQEVLAFENYFKDRPGRLQEADLRHAGPPGRCRAGRRRAGLPPLLRLAGRRASGAAQGRRDPGRDAGRHRRRHPAAASTSSISRCPRSAPTRPTTRRSRPGSGQAGTKLYLGLLHHDDEAGDRTRVAVAKQVQSTISGSRPNAAGAGPSRAGCPGCSKVIVLLRRHSDG